MIKPRAEKNAAPTGINILIWGPPRSGKRWILWSFAREMEIYNQKHSDFHHEIFMQYPGDISLHPLQVRPPIEPRLDKWQDHNWSFRRSPLVADAAHRLSAHMHDMHISILPGQASVDCLFIPEANEAAKASIARSRFLIAVLDPCRLAPQFGIGERSPGNLSQEAHWTQEEYLAVIQSLLNTFADNNTSMKRSIVFCISKIDQVGERGSPWEVLERIFGNRMLKLLQNYRTQFHLEVITTTAFGELKMHQDSGVLLNDKDWRDWVPVNTAAPFFIFFQEIELELIRRQSTGLGFVLKGMQEKKYIPYRVEDKAA